MKNAANLIIESQTKRIINHIPLLVFPIMPTFNASEVRNVKQSSNVFKQLRGQTTSTEHTVAVILSNDLGFACMAALTVWISVTRKIHGTAMVHASTPLEAVHRRIDDAVGGWRTELLEIVKLTVNPEKLKLACFSTPSERQHYSIAEKNVEDNSAIVSDRFLTHLLGHRILYMSVLEFGFPWSAAALLHKQDIDEVLEKFKAMCWSAWMPRQRHLQVLLIEMYKIRC